MRVSTTRISGTCMLAFTLLLGACGGSGGASSPSPVPPPVTPVVTLQSIAISPTVLTLGIRMSRRLTATATYSDGSKAELGASAAWTSLTPAIATVSGGLVTGVTPGSVTIRVTASGVSADQLVVVASNIWTPAATMLQSLSGFRLNLLPSGKVLSSGGIGLGSDAELYDPALNTWTSVGGVSRLNHTATLLTNGKVLIAGGGDHRAYQPWSATYDPVLNAWSTPVPMLIGRDGHTATLLPSGKVLVAGGIVFPKPDPLSEGLYDPVANTWSAAKLQLVVRRWHTATLLADGRVFTTGGGPNSSEVYDAASDTWTAAPSMVHARAIHTATMLPNGKILIAGGSSSTGAAELYDPATMAWSPAGSLATMRWGHVATLLPNGKVLVLGGIGVGNIDLATTEIYDPATNQWSPGAPMSIARGNPGTALMQDGSLLVCGSFVVPGGTACELYWH